MTASAGPEAEQATGFRPDIEGLRGVAVLLIVLYHAGLPGLAGGYVGVDGFFVISGFLITSLLARELDETGRLDLAQFYARRVRRILPAAFVVLGATIVGCLVFLSPVGFWRAAPGIAAAAAYVPNVLFAFAQTDYFHPARISPVIHYWSLGVEEQFYVVWPAFLWLAYRFAAGARVRLAWIVLALVVGSVALSVVGTSRFPTLAFYLLPTRAWELGAGALVALAVRDRGLPLPAANAAGAAGIAVIVGAAVVFQESTPFPGLAALVPVLGTVLVIVAGAARQRTWAAIGLGWAPMRYIGRISYSLYLWHWPLLVFAAIALAALPGPVQATVAVAASFVLAGATFRWVEDPLRRGQLIGRRPSRNLATALVASLLIAGLALGGGRLEVAPFRQAAAIVAVPIGVDPFIGLIPAAGPTADGPLPADLIPPLLNLQRGKVANRPKADGCSLLTGQTIHGPCTYGDPASPTKVVLFGDSHLAQWWPAIERVMAARHWQVIFLVKTSCAYEDMNPASGPGPRTECDTWREQAMARITRERPDLVILAANHRHPLLVDGVLHDGSDAWPALQAGAERTISRLQADGARVAVLGDTPQIPYDPAECLSAHADHILRCAVARDQAVEPGWIALERAAAESLGATFADVDAWICPSDPCPLVIGRYAVYADTNHITRPFAQGLTARLDAALLP